MMRSFEYSSASLGLKERAQLRVHCHVNPSQKPKDAMEALGKVDSENRRGKMVLRGLGPIQISCQNWVEAPFPIRFLILQCGIFFLQLGEKRLQIQL